MYRSWRSVARHHCQLHRGVARFNAGRMSECFILELNKYRTYKNIGNRQSSRGHEYERSVGLSFDLMNRKSDTA